jgi:diguanylate cyclase (GGDEF)-like protein/PAS domain S-box-containing protein
MFFMLFLLLLVLSLIVAVSFATYALSHQQTPGARPFAVVLLGYGLSAAGYVGELLADTLAAKIIWDNLQFTSLDIIVVGSVWFALEYTNSAMAYRPKAIRWLLPLFLGLPVLNALLVWTNPLHHLVGSVSHMIVQGELSVLAYTYGPWFWVYLSYIYFGTLLAVGILAVACVQARRFYQLHVGALIIGMLAPLVSGVFTGSGIIPLSEREYLDVSPLTALIIAPLWSWALFHRRFLDLVPMARSHLGEAMPDGVLVVDAQGRIVDCNAHMRTLLPEPNASCIGAPATTVLPELAPLLADEPSQIITNAAREADAAADGQRWLELRSTPLRNAGTQQVGWLVIAHDRTDHYQMEQELREQNARLEREIAERKQAEEALRESEERFAAFMEYLPGPAFIHDHHGRVLFANRFYCWHMGRPAEEVIGQPYDTLLPPEAAAYFRDQDQQVLAAQQVCVFEDQAEMGSQTRTFLTTKFPMQQADGSIHIGGVAVDITERKQAEEELRENEARLQAIFDNAAVGIGLMDNAGKSIAVNARGAQQLGYTPEELAQLSNTDITHPDDQAATTEQIQQLVRGEIQGYRIEKRYFRKDGSIFWADLSVSSVYDDTGKIAYLLGIVVDITERKQAEEALRESEQFVQQIATMIPGILYVYDLTLERNVYSNRQIWEVLGYTAEEVQAMGSMAIPSLLHPEDMPTVLRHRMLHEHAEVGTILNVEYRMRHRDGNWRWLLSREVVFLRSNEGRAQQILGIAQDITEQKNLAQQLYQANMRLQEQAIRDSLTGLHNRRYLDETLPRELQRAQRHYQSIGMIMLDVDHFKHFNDSYGHDAGDTLLREIGAFLQRNTRGDDITCRYGGEEFILVLPGASVADTRQRAEMLCTDIQALAINHKGHPLHTVTASFGVAVFPDHASTADDLVRAADQALYQAKQGGRNAVHVAR